MVKKSNKWGGESDFNLSNLNIIKKAILQSVILNSFL